MLSFRRRVAAIVLGFGAFAGFASGLHALTGHHGWRARHREDFEARVAEVCTRAAERVLEEKGRAGVQRAP